MTDDLKDLIKFVRDNWHDTNECPPRWRKLKTCDDTKCLECFEQWLQGIEKRAGL